jgi:hypothetical protein
VSHDSLHEANHCEAPGFPDKIIQQSPAIVIFCLEAVMLLLRLVFVLACSLCMSLAWAQAPADAKKSDDLVAMAEVRFTDESIVRMAILQEHLEIATKYGKLIIPTSDITKVDFGVHVPKELESKIAKAIEDLGSDVYKTREVATKDLVSWGPYAYPQLYKAAKSNQLEVQKRVVVALDKLKSKHPAHSLRLREEDIVVTPNFTVVGQIITPTLKARAENFGELDLRLAKLRGIRWLGKNPEIQVTIDAAKHGIPGQWMDTGYEVHQDMRLHIVANGTVNLLPQNQGFVCGPRGFNNGQGGQMAPGLPFAPGALLGKVGTDGPMFMIGEDYTGSPNREGKLFLHIAPSAWNQNASMGTFSVKISPKSEFGGD